MSGVAVLEIPRTVFAVGALAALASELDRLGAQRPLLVTDRGVSVAGLAARAIASSGAGRAVQVFGDVTENPLFADVDRGAACYREWQCDTVIALGGGSVIDTAKLIALLAGNAGHIAQHVGVRNADLLRGAPLIAIPTTAGTGSEASASAGVHADAHTAAVGLNHRYLVPQVAILDPALTLSLPPHLTAATGIDALSHCIEGYLSQRASPLGKAMALDGVTRVARYLRRAVADGADLEARGQMMHAAFAGGVAIGMGLGPAHAIALSCSDQGFAHGVLSGIGLVATLDATHHAIQTHAPEKMQTLLTAFGWPAERSLSQGVAALMTEVGLPVTLAELGYEARDPGALARLANASHFNLFAPFHPTVAGYAALLERSLSRA